MVEINIHLPLKVISALNSREHYMARSRRVRTERAAVGLVLQAAKRPPLPIAIHLTRLSPGVLDSHDNLCSSFKGTIDEIARVFGVDDRSDQISVTYAQEKTPKRVYGIRIAIKTKEPATPEKRA